MGNKTVIESESSILSFINEILEYKSLVWVFAWRDLRVKYSQTAIGLVWAFIQPVFTIVILWLVFGRFLNIDTDGTPKLAFVASGVAIWSYFGFVSQQSAQSIIQAQQMIKKIYFPKIILPLSKAILGMVDLLVVLLILLTITLSSSVVLTWKVILIPFVIISLIVFALGVGIWISALSIKYRDLQHVFPFVIQLGVYITPVAYPTEVVQKFLPNWAVVVYYLNPVAGLIDIFRSLLFNQNLNNEYWYYSIISGFLIFLLGVNYFRITERKIADLV